ncbi:hypothetical protein E2P61_07095 [Candidatus Bathyarchaeota archaeon]|jgi:hypothetical protein|nr:hypothetical protein E2P61_07095 [Candidatus Bathyarchaeota archaeon]
MRWLENIVFQIMRLFRRPPLNRALMVNSPRSFNMYFKDFEKIEAVKGIFGEKTTEILQNLKVDLIWFSGYMYVNTYNGHLVVSARYLKKGDKIDIYLDLIHELCHIKQFMNGSDLFDPQYNYVERPTEIEAYRYTVCEARRLGLSDERICEYLKTEWITDRDLRLLAGALNVKC